jgi:hypothetical protein
MKAVEFENNETYSTIVTSLKKTYLSLNSSAGIVESNVLDQALNAMGDFITFCNGKISIPENMPKKQSFAYEILPHIIEQLMSSAWGALYEQLGMCKAIMSRELNRRALENVNDSFLTTVCIMYPYDLVAVACVHLGLLQINRKLGFMMQIIEESDVEIKQYWFEILRSAERGSIEKIIQLVSAIQTPVASSR